MKNPLNRRVFREIKENAGKYFGIFCILACIIFVGSAFMVTMKSTELSLAKQEEDCLTEDGQFELLFRLPEECESFFTDNHIILEENFYATENEFEGEAKVLLFDERDTLNLLCYFEGGAPKGENEIVLDRLFAENRKVKVGDKVQLCGREYTVTGLAAFADYTSLFKSNQDLVMDFKNFGISMVSHAGFEKFSEEQITHRYSYYYEDRELTDKEKNQIVEKMQENLLTKGAIPTAFLTAERNQSISFLKMDMGKDGPMMEVFLYILLAIIAFVFAILTGNTIEKEATVIGTLRSMGYTRWEMIWHYLRPTLLVTLLGAAVGNLIGYTWMLKPFMAMYYSSYSLPPVAITFSLRAFLITTVAPFVIMAVINVALLYNKLVLNPLKFLRKDLKKGKQKKVVKLPNISFLGRFRIRVILQNKVCYLILFFGIYISGLLLTFGIGLSPMFDHYVASINDTLPYEYQYLLKAPVENEAGEKVKVYAMNCYSKQYKKDVEITILGVEDDSRFFAYDAAQNENEAVVSNPMAKKLKLKVGDTFTLQDSYTDEEYSFTVTEICDYEGSLGFFMRRETLNRLLGAEEEDFNCLISNEKLDIDEAYIAKYLTRGDIVGATGELMNTFDTVLKVFSVSSVIIYMILMYILTKTVIEKNALYISFLKVFGYNGKEAGKLYLHATTITVLLSLLICMPLQHFSFILLMDYITGMIEGYVPFYLPLWVYLFVLGVGAVSYFIINGIHIQKVKKIPMSDALKNRE